MNPLFHDAVNKRCVLEFTYQGHHRVVEPHAYGLSRQHNEVIRCYQTGGTSSSDTLPCWRLMEIAQIRDLVVSDKHFVGTRPGYARGDMHMSTIFCEL